MDLLCTQALQAKRAQSRFQAQGFLTQMSHAYTEPHRCVFHRLLGWEARRVTIGPELIVQLVCAGLDGHASAVEALRKQHPLPTQAVVCAGELQLHSAAEYHEMTKPGACHAGSYLPGLGITNAAFRITENIVQSHTNAEAELRVSPLAA